MAVPHSVPDMTHPVTSLASPPTGRARQRRHHVGLEAIALFKLVKGVLLLAAAIGLLRLMGRDIPHLVVRWVTVLGMDPDAHYVRLLLSKLAAVDPHKLKAVSAGSFFYAGLLLSEGIGLWFEWRWAEYLTVIGTSCFVPLELYRLSRGVHPLTLVVLGLNLVIVAYLVFILRQSRRRPAP